MSQITRTLRRVLSDISYADRRLYELRTGVKVTPARTK